MATDLPSELTAVQPVQMVELEPEESQDKSDQHFNVIDPQRQIQEPEFLNDVGLWRHITNTVQEHWCSRDPIEC